MTTFVPKTMLADKKAMDKILSGAKKAYDAVTATMGPNGNLVGFNSESAVFDTYTKDGVSVAKQITLKDEAENMGALLLIQAALKQVEESGDGTTLVTLLAYEMIKNGLKAIKKGTNPTLLQKGIDIEVQNLIELIRKRSSKNITKHILQNVARIAVNNNKELGDLIANAIHETGENGIVTKDKSPNDKNFVEFAKGYQIDTGIQAQEFVNNQKHYNYDTKDVNVIVTDYPLYYGPQLNKVAELIQKEPTILVAEEVREEALHAIIQSQKSGMNLVVIEVTGLPMEKEYTLRDIAAVTGAAFISQKTGSSMEKIKKSDIGKCDRIISAPRKTIFYNDDKQDNIVKRTDYLLGKKEDLIKSQDTTEKFEIDIIDKSVAKLTGGIAVIKVAANTESEQLEILDRVDDAIRACQSAIEEGITDGGGMALLNAVKEIEGKKRPAFQSLLDGLLATVIDIEYEDDYSYDFSEDIFIGKAIVRKAACEPIRKILQNADIKPDKILNDLDSNKQREWREWKGYSLSTRAATYHSMSDQGIIDPVKVIRTALINASSVAKVILQTKVLLIEDRTMDKE